MAMERYQLSQDFQEKQLQLLQRKYGGARQAGAAALVIQRAFRRYSMGKKFADLTAHAKSEQRISRRLEYPVGGDALSSGVAGKLLQATSSPSSAAAAAASHHRCSSHHHHHYHHHSGRHHHHHHHEAFASTSTVVVTTTGASPLSAASTAPGTPRSVILGGKDDVSPASAVSEDERTAVSLPHPSSASSLEVDVADGAAGGTDGSGGGGTGSSCPDIQSFPLDETSVYSYPLRNGSTRSSSSHRGSVKSNGSGSLAAPSAGAAAATSSSDVADSPRVKKSSQLSSKSSSSSSVQHTTSAPSVPKRTVSQLSSGSESGGGAGGSKSSLGPSLSASPGQAPHHHQHHHQRHHHGQQHQHQQHALTPTTSSSSSSSAGARRQPQQPHSFGDGEVRLRHHHHHHHHQPHQQQQQHSSPSLLQTQQQQHLSSHPAAVAAFHRGSPAGGGGGENYTASEVIRKRHYRTGLNIFNKRPEKGIAYLIRRGFLENSPQAVARFLITRKGLSKQMIGEYLGNIAHPFNTAALNCFALEMDFGGMQIDTALRKFQTYFRMPGEAQKIERLMEVFSSRYCQCNPDAVSKLHSTDTAFILAFAIILLNTDLHTPSLKPEKRMKAEDFIRNLRGIDDGHDVDPDLLMGIYDRVRNQEFKPGGDHVTQVMKVQQTIVSKCPNLALPHRRLVCYCRLYEVPDPHKKERPGVHQREVFLFNDILVITKIHSRKKNSVTYAFRQSHLLAGMSVSLFETQFYPFGIQIAQKYLGKVILRLNARNEHDRSKFVEDLRESIAEMDEMEALRLEAELEKQRASITSVSAAAAASTPSPSAVANGDAKKNSQAATSPPNTAGASAAVTGGSVRSRTAPHTGAAGHHGLPPSHGNHHPTRGTQAEANGGVVLRRSAINNSLLDLSEATMAEKVARRGSVGSLDSGMSISFQSTSVGSFQQQQQQQLHQAGAMDAQHPARSSSKSSSSAAAAASADGGVSGGVRSRHVRR